tara:strand:- start:1114 stop:1302 length:189 start_codon:yes stop_codon:yes gene_type:complete
MKAGFLTAGHWKKKDLAADHHLDPKPVTFYPAYASTRLNRLNKIGHGFLPRKLWRVNAIFEF